MFTNTSKETGTGKKTNKKEDEKKKEQKRSPVILYKYASLMQCTYSQIFSGNMISVKIEIHIRYNNSLFVI